MFGFRFLIAFIGFAFIGFAFIGFVGFIAFIAFVAFAMVLAPLGVADGTNMKGVRYTAKRNKSEITLRLLRDHTKALEIQRSPDHTA
jgi:hypothetical protein